MNRLFFLLLILSGFCVSCYYDSEESLYPDLGSCDTLKVTYSGSIVPLLDNNCLGCHSLTESHNKGGDVVLEGYSNVVNARDAVIQSINHIGPNPMPKDAGKLKNCLIRQFEIWVDSGYLDN